MIKIEAILQPSKLDAVKDALLEAGIEGMTCLLYTSTLVEMAVFMRRRITQRCYSVPEKNHSQPARWISTLAASTIMLREWKPRCDLKLERGFAALVVADADGVVNLADEDLAVEMCIRDRHYVGPAPVTLEEFTYQVSLQKLTNELVTFERIREALGELTFDAGIIEQSGPALNSGRAMLLYGPPGNGKSSVAHCLGGVFSDVIYVPYAVTVEGQIIRVHDPGIHTALSSTTLSDESKVSFLRYEEYDARWVPCRRPFVLAGGELTLEMLDLRYDTTGHFYEAPLHVKALGGCFVIDDFGRQLVSPTSLLNRWICLLYTSRCV